MIEPDGRETKVTTSRETAFRYRGETLRAALGLPEGCEVFVRVPPGGPISSGDVLPIGDDVMLEAHLLETHTGVEGAVGPRGGRPDGPLGPEHSGREPSPGPVLPAAGDLRDDTAQASAIVDAALARLLGDLKQAGLTDVSFVHGISWTSAGRRHLIQGTSGDVAAIAMLATLLAREAECRVFHSKPAAGGRP